ncbi:MAG TPA: site-specific DNA-methyltransferase [Flavisolibacter sp.]|jgi:site-specific DNA-methyltransferase (adenine-specific)/adenine-specific DNA-methyltransferase|nr:site-specific DNA-methyltransferase [Flavisolibacter sp.]
MAKKQEYELKAEYELVYKGKEPKQSVLTNTPEAPLQEVRIFNEENPWEDGWKNMLIFGDNLMALKTLYEDIKKGGPNKYGLRNKIKLVYIDPPFATKQDFMKDKEKAYRDKVFGSQFIEFLRKRLFFLREILADDGSIYVHLDYKKGHYIKTVLDEVFGEPNFLNEIIWQRTTNTGSSKALAKKFSADTDVIFLYRKNADNYIFNKLFKNYGASYLERFKYDDKDGKGAYRWQYMKTYSQKKLQELEEKKELRWENKSKNPEYKQYVKNLKGVPLNNLWTDIYHVNPMALENASYPTQKPEELLKRIIETSSNKGDVILDAFAGSGTTLTTAEKLERKWIGIDCGKLSMYTIQSRLITLTDGITTSKKEVGLSNRISSADFDSAKSCLVISDNSLKEQPTIDQTFLANLNHFVKATLKTKHFTIFCPESKFRIGSIEEDEEGSRIVRNDDITYYINFIESKENATKPKLKLAKSFSLFYTGIYDKDRILDLKWDQYKDFVLKLFEVRHHAHEIRGVQMQGYIGVNSAYVWDYPNHPNLALDEEFVEELHKQLNNKAGDRLYVIVPTNAVQFMQNEIKHGDTVYTFLKVPVSVLVRLMHSYKEGKIDALAPFKQPRRKEDVNEVIDAFGFDFISQPVTEYKLLKRKQNDGLFESDVFIIRLTDFRSKGLLYSPDQFKKFETLSLVLIDYNYPNSASPFVMDDFRWGGNLVKEDVKEVDIVLPADKWERDNLAVIMIDIYGNEKSLVLTKKDFK